MSIETLSKVMNAQLDSPIRKSVALSLAYLSDKVGRGVFVQILHVAIKADVDEMEAIKVLRELENATILTSPDGQSIAFLRLSQDTNGNGVVDYEDMGDVWVGAASGGGLRQLTSGMWATTPAWSPDSNWIAFARMYDSNGNGKSDGKDAADIYAVPLGGGKAVPLLESPYRDGDPSWTW